MKLLLGCAVAVLLAGCGDPAPVAQGPGSETSGFGARVLDSLGRPKTGVEVRVVALDRSWRVDALEGADPVLARQWSDAEGRVQFKLRHAGRVALEVRDSVWAGRREIEIVPGGQTDLALVRGGTLRVQSTVPGEVVSGLLLAGTAYSAIRDGSGGWTFEGVPAGWYTVAAATDSGLSLLGRVHSLAGQKLDTALRADADSVLLEDFEAPAIRNRYGELLGAGWWYTTTDAIYGGKSTATPGDASQARIDCGAKKCLDISFAIEASNPQKFALVGMDIDRSRNPSDPAEKLADLSRISAVRFWASGSGAIRVQVHLHSAAGDHSCSAPVVLDSAWTRREIARSGLVCDSGAAADWSAAVGITFMATSDARLRLGSIVLAGAGPRSVFSDLNHRGIP